MITSKIKTKPTISAKIIIVKPLSSKYGVSYKNKTIHTPPHPLHSKLGCLLISTGSSTSCTTLHGGARESFIFHFLIWQKVREFLWGKVSQLILLPVVAKKYINILNHLPWTSTSAYQLSRIENA